MGDSLSRFLAGSRSRGRLESTGAFSLDAAAALRKLPSFKDNDLGSLVIHWVRFAVVSGADRVELESGKGQSMLRLAPNRRLPPLGEGLDLWRCLAGWMGREGAFALEASASTLCYEAGEFWLEEPESGPDSLSLTVAADLDELHPMERVFSLCPLPVTLDGRLLNHSLSAPFFRARRPAELRLPARRGGFRCPARAIAGLVEWEAREEVQGESTLLELRKSSHLDWSDSFRLEAWLCLDEPSAPLHHLRAGVLLETVHEGLGFGGLVDSTDLATDLSGERLVQGKALEERLQLWAREAAWLERRLKESYPGMPRAQRLDAARWMMAGGG